MAKRKRPRVIIKMRQKVAQGRPSSTQLSSGVSVGELAEQIYDMEGIVDNDRRKVVKSGLAAAFSASNTDKALITIDDIIRSVDNGKVRIDDKAKYGGVAVNVDCNGIRAYNTLQEAFPTNEPVMLSFYISCVIDTLTEVMDMLCQRAQHETHKVAMKLAKDDQHYWNVYKKKVQDLRNHFKYRLSRHLTAVETKYGEAALDDSDWLKDIIMLAIDRVGNNPEERYPMLKRAMLRMKSNMDDMYDKHFKV